MIKRIITFAANHSYLACFIIVLLAYIYYLELPPMLFLDYFSILAVISLTAIMRYIISGTILPLRLLKYDSEYGAYQYFKNAEDAILPSAMFVTLSIFPVILLLLLFQRESAPTLIGPGIAAITLSCMILSLLFAHYLNRESISLYKTPKRGLMLSRQFPTSLVLNILFQGNILFMMLISFALPSQDGVSFVDKIRALSEQILSLPDGTGSDILVFSIIFGAVGTLILNRRFSNRRIFYAAAINLNLSSSVLSICFLVKTLVTLNAVDVSTIARYFLNPVKYVLVVEVISIMLMLLHVYLNRNSPEIYIKPVRYSGSKKLEVAFGLVAMVVFIAAYLQVGIVSIYQLAFIFCAIIAVNVISIRKKRAINGLIASRTLELEEKNAENERLLLNILPGSIAERLKKGEGKIADYFEKVTVLFADIVGFTVLSQQMTSEALVDRLNDLFSAFDRVALKFNIEKIKTIGDCYMAVAGLFEKQENHAESVLRMAFDLLEVIREFNEKFGMALSIRIGINSGEVVAGVIGKHKFIYDLWGDSVNIASRMESHGVAGRIHVTRETYEILKDRFSFEPRGPIEVKGKGKMETFFAVR